MRSKVKIITGAVRLRAPQQKRKGKTMAEQLGMFWLEDEDRPYDWTEDNEAKERAYQAEQIRKEHADDDYWEKIREKRREQWYTRDD